MLSMLYTYLMPSLPHIEFQASMSGQKLNWLRAAVLGANDGIVSVAALLVGVAGATESIGFITTAGVAGILSGALSMAVGEYVSVSTQRDSEKALIEKEKRELAEFPEEELQELTALYQAKGLSLQTAQKVAQELTSHDAFAAHAEAELGIDPHNLTNPWYAAIASGLSFSVGALVPLLIVIFSPAPLRIVGTFIAVALALMITGAWSAHEGGASKRRATLRVVAGGAIAMAITFGVGKLFGVMGI
jgi:VIT1/CCC1 family predicted Fe2+/Mn2+ transporter